MKSYEQTSTLFWLLISVLVMAESLRIGIGTARTPSIGFMPFGASAIMAALSLANLIKTSSAPKDATAERPFPDGSYRRVVPSLAALVLYALILPLVGYVVATFLLMTFLFWLANPGGRWMIVLASSLATLATQYVFQILLDSQLPTGPFGF